MSNKSLAESIADRLIIDFKHDMALPSERKLSEYYNCNRMTVRRALQMLTERGQITNSRRKHFISDSAKINSSTEDTKQQVVMVLSFEKELFDHTRTYMLGGIIHGAAQCGLQVVFKELTVAMLEKINSCADIDESFDVAGYLVTGPAPLRLHDILSTSLKPCVINGTFIGEEDIKCRIRFMEIRIDYAAIFRDIARQLLSLGHRKILLGHSSEGFMIRQIQRGVLEAIKQLNLPEEILTTKVYEVDIFNNSDNVRLVANRIANDAKNYSALLLPCGNIFGMETVNALRENNISIPENLSLAMVGCETDYFIPVLGISSTWVDVRELGAFCIRELNRQIQSGRTEYGISYFSTTFIERNSIDKAKK